MAGEVSDLPFVVFLLLEFVGVGLVLEGLVVLMVLV